MGDLIVSYVIEKQDVTIQAAPCLRMNLILSGGLGRLEPVPCPPDQRAEDNAREEQGQREGDHRRVALFEALLGIV
jgi:hypothetical protein